MNKTTVEGKVAQILSEREVVINVGAEHGVMTGMKFAVLAATPLEVRDPDTDVVLDTIDREKVRVQATEVRDKVTICSTYETKIVGVSWTIAMLNPPRKVYRTFKAEDSQFAAPISEAESYVKVGDRVRNVEDVQESQ